MVSAKRLFNIAARRALASDNCSSQENSTSTLREQKFSEKLPIIHSNKIKAVKVNQQPSN